MRKSIIATWLQILIITGSSINSLSITYFSPEDHPTKKLIELIDSAKKTIHAAVYMVTDKTIAEALIRAKKERKVDVQIITDKITVTSSFGKAHLLRENEIKVWFLDAPSSTQKAGTFFYAAPAIMHHKFALIDNNLWTGSFNWTRAANQKNHEDVLLTDNRESFQSFKKQFEKLKEKCAVLTTAHASMRGEKNIPSLG